MYVLNVIYTNIPGRENIVLCSCFQFNIGGNVRDGMMFVLLLFHSAFNKIALYLYECIAMLLTSSADATVYKERFIYNERIMKIL